MSDILMWENPRRKRSRRRNPARALAVTQRRWFQGVSIGDGVAATGGFVAAGLVPGYIVKDTSTGWGKFWKLLVAGAAAAGAGYIGKSVSPAAGKAAVLGGLIGVITQGIVMFFPSIPIGGIRGKLGRATGIGTSTLVVPGVVPEAGGEGFQPSVT